MNSPNQMWLSIEKEYRKMIVNNVWCANCVDEITIVQYVIQEHSTGIVLRGKCKNCGQDAARVVEFEQ
ncbi:hypothetical protein [Chengkuizengella axinellae]|uniref:GapA-binding peptide SR1P n=1 Tax=Chengkuizengella axinellae TaxID=3064388 RepID=A0ABT9J411_9BACL|nr:hypothetical protein [Chengkuizengella sp. 2205SS18-9]MDP5276385.1 hypothetical protein [Chengkuizengella sp. 2205SS18-9]